jgi:hypothetical protein
MAKSVQKITLSQSRDIPFNKQLLSQSNVRRIKAGVLIEELAQDIARRTLLQSLTVRPVLDGDGNETGMFEVPAGGRRYRALELLVQQKRLTRAAPIPCVVRTEGLAEEDSLAENVQRAPQAKGETAAQLIEHLKKSAMAVRAEELLAGSGWIPEPLRTPGQVIRSTSLAPEPSQASAVASAREETAVTGYETAMVDPEGPAEDAHVLAEQQPVAAE